jgi:hypothetical protein
MRLIAFLCALVLMSGTSASARAADLTRTDRTIAKEPAYKSEPRYCLLVFGPKAKTQVWLVQDGDFLYVDRNGSGDLTQRGKRVALSGALGDITEPGHGPRHTALKVSPCKDSGVVVAMTAEGKYPQRSGRVTFAARSEEAPILHFNGPVSVRFSSAVADGDCGQVARPAAELSPREVLLRQLENQSRLPGERRRTKVMSLGAVLGTPGVGEGTFVTYNARDILGQPNERIVVEAAFPNQDAGAGPITVTGFLRPDS